MNMTHPLKLIRLCIFSFSLAALWQPALLNARPGDTGTIVGSVVEAETGGVIAAANVYLRNTKLGALTDQSGNFAINSVPPGVYRLVVSKTGYRQQETQLSVTADKRVNLVFKLQTETIEMEQLLIEGTAPTEKPQDKLLEERRQAVEIQDAIGAEDMSRTGSGNAAEAVSRTTGASVVDGKYVYIRGLGERYSSTQLNGSELPSADPYRKAVQMDLFSSNLLDKIVTVKTFSPDKPGAFSGGSVELWTKRFPEKFTFSFSQSASYNSLSSFNDNALTYPGGKRDWLGMGGETRALPALLKDPNFKVPSIGAAWKDREMAHELDLISKAFSPVMAPRKGTLPANQGYTVSIGNQVKFLNRPLGLLGSFSYGRNTSFYEHGTAAQWLLTGNVNQVDELNYDYKLDDTRATDEVLWGGLANASYKIDSANILGFNFMYNQSGESEARALSGPFPRDLTGNSIYETRVLKYTERTLGSYQLRGEHDIARLFKSHLEWTATVNRSDQLEPDLRYFTDNYTIVTRNSVVDTAYSIRPSIYPVPNRYFRKLNENNVNLDLKISLPFKQWAGLHSELKFGGAYNDTDRKFRENRYEFRLDNSQYSYQGDPYAYWLPANVGLVDTTGRLNRFANYVTDASEARGNYDGAQKIGAGFVMVDMPLTKKLQFVGGVRLENTRLEVSSHDATLTGGRLDEIDYLPAANFIFLLQDNMNLRAAYGRTLARPTFREMAPYSSFDFVNDFIFTGNAELKRTLIDNFDLRWEWFTRSGEVLASSFFYKRFQNPIERVIKTINGEVQYQNVSHADLLGAEFEARQELDRIHPRLDKLALGLNLALVKSTVDIAADELSKIRAFDSNAADKRPLQGQSPFVLNTDLSYYQESWGTTATLVYGLFGRRLSEVSLGGTPNIYEKQRGMLDFNLKQKVWGNISLKFSAKNLLGAEVEKVHTYKGREYPSQVYKLGRVFTLGLGYNRQAE